MQQQDEQMQQGQSGKIKCCVLGVGGKGAPAHAAKSVVRALAELPDFYVRCAVAPSQLSEPHVQGIDALPNCEIYRCDYSADELADCLRDCDFVFSCTDHFDPAIHGNEQVVGKSIVTVAKQLGVKHLIWLGAPNPEFESGGKWKVPMFQDKSVVADYIQEQGLPATVLVSSVPYQHFSDPNGAFIPRLESDKLVITMPLGADKYLTGFDMEDVGGVVKNIFKQCKDGQWKSSGVQFIPMVGDHKPLRDWISDIQHATGHRVQLNSPSIEEFEKLDVPHAFDWAQLCGWIADHECLGKTEKDMFDYCKQLAPLKSFSEWANEGLAMFASGGSGARMVV